MPANLHHETDDLCLVHISGKLSIEEITQAQAECEKVIQSNGSARLLVVLEGFEGWQREAGWEDTSFAERNDQYIKKLAIVGDEQWRDMAYVFTLRDLRPVPIEYFAEGELDVARAWLDK